MLGRLDVLRIVSNKLGQLHAVRGWDAPMCRRDVTIETSRFHLETITARTSQETHYPRISAQTVRNRFQEIF